MIKLRVSDIELEYPIRSINQYLLRLKIIESLKNLFFKNRLKIDLNTQKSIKALNKIDFELSEGDRLGLLGLNGSGKSTLLKCLSNILPKTGEE